MATKRACDVCLLLDGDSTPKQVGYCGFCHAYICDPCFGDNARRIKAFARKKGMSWSAFEEGLKKYLGR